MPSLWIDALKEFNRGKDMYCIPRKGTEPNAKVRRMMKGEAVSPEKKPAEKKDMATSAKSESKKIEIPKPKTVSPKKPKTMSPKKTATPKAATPKSATPKKILFEFPKVKVDTLQNFMDTAPEDITGYNYGKPNKKGELAKGVIQKMVGKIPSTLSEERSKNINDIVVSLSELAGGLFKLYKKSDDRDSDERDKENLLIRYINDTNFKEKYTEKIGAGLIKLCKKSVIDTDALFMLHKAIARISMALKMSLNVSKNVSYDLYEEHVEPPYGAPGPTEVIESLASLLPGKLIYTDGNAEQDNGYEDDDEDIPYTFTISVSTNIVPSWERVSYAVAKKLNDAAYEIRNAPMIAANKVIEESNKKIRAEKATKRKGEAEAGGIPQGKKNAKIFTLAEFLIAYKLYNPEASQETLDKFKGPKITAYFARTKLHYGNIK